MVSVVFDDGTWVHDIWRAAADQLTVVGAQSCGDRRVASTAIRAEVAADEYLTSANLGGELRDDDCGVTESIDQ